jgi:2-C-methyl-D-erythritol 2,4-cyclodiphosphate synthase
LSDRTPHSGIDRVGIGTDLHRLVPGRKLILGHVPIEFEWGLLGHSDGDVIMHALIDAMAGAAGLPDIGEMYPDSDSAYKDADSAALLETSIRAVRGKGYTIVNADVTIHAERPKLSPYKPAIRQEVARLLDVPLDAVSIKAKTNEGVDAVGRGEAIACTAIVSLRIIG